MSEHIYGGSGSFAVPFDEQREIRYRPAPEAPDVPVRAGVSERELTAMLDSQAAEQLPEGTTLPITINVRPDSERSVMLGSSIIGPGESLTIDETVWRQLGSAGPGVVELVRNEERQRGMFDGRVLLREGPGQPIELKPGSLPWRRRKQAQFAEVDNLRPGPERDLARQSLEEHYARPEQQPEDKFVHAGGVTFQ